MGIVIPRPAMRSREERMIRARLRHFDTRHAELLASGATDDDATAIAYKEARSLRFNRKGEVCNRATLPSFAP